MHNPWKVRSILAGGLVVLGCTLLAKEGWQVGLILAVAVGFFFWGIKEAASDPYDLQELDLLEQKFGDVSVENKTAICPHCGEEYPARRSMCPHCLRSP